ncbi:ATP-binding protein [Candidatus Gracilibacteria bacterium]|nr:ATP-binding protein [Candidatus Gracilibacteria bacterium]
MMQGLPCSGKTTTSRKMIGFDNLVFESTDNLRGEIHRVDPFNPSDRSAVYDALFFKVRARLNEGRNLLVDATFSSKSRRNVVYSLCSEFRASLIIVTCTAPDVVLRTRMATRIKSGDLPSFFLVDTLGLVSSENELVSFEEVSGLEQVALITFDTDAETLLENHCKGRPKFYDQVKRVLRR